MRKTIDSKANVKEESFHKLVEQLCENGRCVSAYEYFAILRLAINHEMKLTPKSSFETTQVEMTDKAYDTAIKILKTLYNL